MLKRWNSLVASAALLCMLAACGVPATGSTSSSPTAPAATEIVPPPTVDALPTPEATVTEQTTTPSEGATTESTSIPDATTPAGGSTDLAGSSWQLTKYGEEGSLQTAIGESTVVFGTDGKIGGNGGCNSYGGTYTYDGTTFTVSELVSTMMACADNAQNEQESAFTGALGQATGLTIDGDTLTITYPDGVLRFTRMGAATDGTATNLQGSSWQLTEYGQEGSLQTVKGEVTVEFGTDNKITGNGGCNGYGGTYSYDGTTLSVSELFSTEMACADNALTEQESAYTQALTQATALTIDGDTLTITYPSGILRFTRLAAAASSPLEGTTWNLESIVSGAGDNASASSVVAGSTLTAEWNNGTVNGSAGCNQFSANYTLEGETLEVGDVITTRMACDGSIMAQETAFVNALDTATALRIEDGKLIVTHPEGELVFTAAQ